MRWRWGAVALAIVLVGVGAFLIADRDHESLRKEVAGESDATDSVIGRLTALATLKEKLEDRYPVEVVAPADLPERRPVIEEGGLPSRIRATKGLVVTLPSGGTGLIYSYRSNDLAMAGATSFLGRNDPSTGVSGCGRIIFFSRASTASAEAWTARVPALLNETQRKCGAEFSVIE